MTIQMKSDKTVRFGKECGKDYRVIWSYGKNDFPQDFFCDKKRKEVQNERITDQ